MSKTTFLNSLRKELKPLPREDIRQYIDYYSEMIDDRMEDGLSEDGAVAALGSAADIAAQILTDNPPKPGRKFKIWEIVLLVLGSPIWLTLGLGAVMLLLGLMLIAISAYVVLWSAIIVLYAADLCLLAGLVTGIAGGFHYAASGMAAPALLFFGGALICGGCMVLLFFACNRLAVWLARLGKWSVLGAIGLFRKKGEKS